MLYRHHKANVFFLSLLFLTLNIFSEGFIAGTLVKTKNGYSPIEQLKKYDSVLSYNFKTKNVEERKIKSVNVKSYSNYIHLIAENTEFKVAPDHKFYSPMNKKRWTFANNLQVGDSILKNVKELLKIDKVNKLNLTNDFYCLSIENNHNYFVSPQDILVHNLVTIPVCTWVIGEGLKWAGLGKWLAAVGAVFLGYIAKQNDIDVSGLDEFFEIKTSYGHNQHKIDDPNKINHVINNPEHGFLDSCNAGGPGEDPEEWIKRIKETISEANKNPNKYNDKKPENILTKWRSSDPRYGELIVKVFKVRGMMKLSTAFLRQIKK